MVKSIKQLEKNVSVSFSYVKKDLLMVNDSMSSLHDKIQHLSLNQAMLLEKMTSIERSLSDKKTPAKKKVSKQKKLEFYDVKTKKKFKSNEYILRTVKGKRMAVAVSPSKTQAYRLLGTVKGSKNKPKKAPKKNKTISTKTVKKTTSTTPKKVITETVLYE